MPQALRRSGWAAALPDSWRAVAGFVARPALPARPAGPGAAGLRSTFSLYALDVALMIPLVLAAMAAEALHEVAGALEKSLGEAESVKLAWKPNVTVEMDEGSAGTLLKLVDTLDDDDDVQTVWGNYDIPDEVMAKLDA